MNNINTGASRSDAEHYIKFTFMSLQADSIPNREFLLVFVTGNRSLCYTDTTCKSLVHVS